MPRAPRNVNPALKKIEDQSVSAVVSTLVLCSVESVEQALKEIIRVLKPVS